MIVHLPLPPEDEVRRLRLQESIDAPPSKKGKGVFLPPAKTRIAVPNIEAFTEAEADLFIAERAKAWRRVAHPMYPGGCIATLPCAICNNRGWLPDVDPLKVLEWLVGKTYAVHPLSMRSLLPYPRFECSLGGNQSEAPTLPLAILRAACMAMKDMEVVS